MSLLVDVLLTRDKAQRPRLSHTLLAFGVMVVAVAVVQFYVGAGLASGAPALLWSALNVAGMLCFYAVIRLGWTRRLPEPSLTAPQMLFAVTSCAAAYALLGPARGGVFPALMLVMVFGVFVLQPRQMLGVVGYAVLLFAVVMALMVNRRPDQYLLAVEVGHFVMLTTMLLAGSVLSVRLTKLRRESKLHRTDLAQALLRLREGSTKEELTGLVNRRHIIWLWRNSSDHSICCCNYYSHTMGHIEQ